MRAASLLLLLLAGCAATPTVPQLTTRPPAESDMSFVLNGRISVKHGGERSSATVHWVHRANVDDILLFAPLGQTVAHIVSDANGASLDASDKHYRAEDAEALTLKALGWHLPLAGLRYWVLAEPSPQSLAEVTRDADGQVSLMRQDGWEIRYSRYVLPSIDSLPSRLSLSREDMELQLLVDDWENPLSAP